MNIVELAIVSTVLWLLVLATAFLITGDVPNPLVSWAATVSAFAMLVGIVLPMMRWAISRLRRR